MAKITHHRCARIPEAAKARLRVLLVAKHAKGDGTPHPQDGNHAVYHYELRTTLEQIGLDVRAEAQFEALDGAVAADLVIPLLNRAGFQNSEMLAPLLLARAGVPFLGASPILRGLADDKHLSKMVARHYGVPTAPWTIHRRGAGPIAPPRTRAERLVVKPNASSASWGVRIHSDWAQARDHAEALQAEGHDVIVEDYCPAMDVAVPVVGGVGTEPWLLPPLCYAPDEPGSLRSYEEKRALVPGGPDPLQPVEDARLVARLECYTRQLTRELWPFDYDRFEFRYDPASDALSFMEVNLSCNLWSQKTISRSAGTLGIDHAALVESIVAHSLARQGVIAVDRLELAA
jgi:D-alanine-D-alanine ligase